MCDDYDARAELIDAIVAKLKYAESRLRSGLPGLPPTRPANDYASLECLCDDAASASDEWLGQAVPPALAFPRNGWDGAFTYPVDEDEL